MTASSLASAPVLGLLGPSGSSPTFTSVAGQPTTVKVLLDSGSPNASVSLMRSLDGGSTWASVPSTTDAFDFAKWQRPVLPVSSISCVYTDPVTTVTVKVADTTSIKNIGYVVISGASVAGLNGVFAANCLDASTFMYWPTGRFATPSGTITAQADQPRLGAHMAKLFTFVDDVSAIYQIVGSSSLKVAVYAAYAGTPLAYPNSNPATIVLGYFGVGVVITDFGQYVPPQFVGLSSDRVLALYQTRIAQLSASNISGDLTLYKRCAGGSLATLSVPAATSRVLDADFHAPNRSVLAASAMVTALVDMQGNPVASDVSIFDPATVYTPGQTVTARDVSGKGRPFGTLLSAITFEGGSGIGISGFTTKLEAAGYGTLRGNLPSPNVSALGL